MLKRAYNASQRKAFGAFRLLAYFHWNHSPSLFKINGRYIDIPRIASLSRHLGCRSVQIREWLRWLEQGHYIGNLEFGGKWGGGVKFYLAPPPNIR